MAIRLSGVIGVAVASFVFPGMGHAMVGRPLAAYVWALAGAAALVLPVVALPLTVLVLVVRIAATVEALRGARGYSRYAAAKAVGPILFGLAGLVGAYVFVEESFQITSTSMAPTLSVGDHVLVDKLTLKAREPRRGEVVVFQFPCARDRDFVKRVVGLPGDLVEVRCDQLWINGRPVETEVVAAKETYRTDVAGGAAEVRVARFEESLDDVRYEVFHSRVGDGRDFPTEGVLPSCGNDKEDGYLPAPAQPDGYLVPREYEQGKTCDRRLGFRVPPESVFVLGDNRAWAFDSRRWGVVPLDHIKGLAIGIWLAGHPDRIGAVR